MTEDPAATARAMKPSKRTIKRLTHAILLFCAGVIGYLAVAGDGDSRLAETIVLGCLGLAGATYSSYVFGAAWDYRNVLALLRERSGR